jgi:hypothetical protein
VIGSELVTIAFSVRIFCLRGQPAFLSFKKTAAIYYDANQSNCMIKITLLSDIDCRILSYSHRKEQEKTFAGKSLISVINLSLACSM